ncbi:MAG: ribosome maturation factor RimM [Gammaproteobacteria bacterium]|nr:ribosome maturation factor RimM [Gammaproteobacteria bacterium]
MTAASERRVAVGRISGSFGVRGWVKVYSYTDPRDNVVGYSPWYLVVNGQSRQVKVLAGRAHGDGVVALIEGVQERDAAEALTGAEIEVDRSVLGKAGRQQFYWTDLQGMMVQTLTGVTLGSVDHLFETGANDVMVVVGEGRHLVPFLYGRVVTGVDMDRRVITVDWDPGF